MSNTDTRSGRAKIASAADSFTTDVARGAKTMERDASDMVDTVKRNAGELAETVSTKLKTVGVDTDIMAHAARDQASELQRMIGQELQTHPMRALGIAAAVGVFVGLMTAR
ncbi:MAG: hypothetical protein NTZ14_09025 [Hyphomicrobiales bacterium]|nr:hypothetical protein [Hyphomicrobiales bacterium]